MRMHRMVLWPYPYFVSGSVAITFRLTVAATLCFSITVVYSLEFNDTTLWKVLR